MYTVGNLEGRGQKYTLFLCIHYKNLVYTLFFSQKNSVYGEHDFLHPCCLDSLFDKVRTCIHFEMANYQDIQVEPLTLTRMLPSTSIFLFYECEGNVNEVLLPKQLINFQIITAFTVTQC